MPSFQAAIYHCPDCAEDYEQQSPEVNPGKSKEHADQGWAGSITSISDNELHSFKLDHIGGYLELVVPTCSYRMGVEDIGYGVAVIGMVCKFIYCRFENCFCNYIINGFIVNVGFNLLV